MQGTGLRTKSQFRAPDFPIVGIFILRMLHDIFFSRCYTEAVLYEKRNLKEFQFKRLSNVVL